MDINLPQPTTLKLGVPFPKERLAKMREYARPFRGINDYTLVPAGAARMDAASESAKWFPHMDAADSLSIARQLEEIRAGLYEIQYAPLKATRLFPFNTSIDRGVEQYTVRAVDRAGKPLPMKG